MRSKWALITPAMTVCLNLCLGVNYVWGVFQQELIAAWNWSNAAATLPFTLVTISYSLGMLAAGALQDRFGPTRVLRSSALLFLAGLILSSRATAPWQMAVSFGGLAGLGLAFAYATALPTAMKWLPESKRGLISGLTVSAFSLTSVYMTPLLDGIIHSRGIPSAFLFLCLIVVPMVTASSFLLRTPPPDYIPQGQCLPAGPAVGRPNVLPRAMLKSPAFYGLFAIYFLCASGAFTINTQIVSIAAIQGQVGNGALLVSVFAFSNFAGRLVFGALSDRLPRQYLLCVLCAVAALNLFFFSGYNTFHLLALGCVISGLSIGACLAVMPALTADFFGLEHFGADFGLVCLASGIAGLCGPLFTGLIVDATGSYNGAYIYCGCFVAVAALLCLTLKAPGASENKKARE